MNTQRVNCRVCYGEEARQLAAQGGTTFGGGSAPHAYAAILIPPGLPVPAQIKFSGTLNGAVFEESCDSSVPTFGGHLEAGGQNFMIMTSPCAAHIAGAKGTLLAIAIIALEGQTAPALEITEVGL